MTSRHFLAALMAALVVLALGLVGCGGAGTPPIGGGGGGGGGERIAASNTGLDNTEIGSGQNASRGRLGQGFLGDGRLVSKASFKPWRLGVPTGSYVVEIRADNNGAPGETVLAASNPVDPTSLPTTAATAVRQDWVFPSSSQCRTAIGVRYWAVARRVEGAYNSSGCLIFRASSNPDSYVGGELRSQHTESGIWQGLDYDAWFIIWTQ